MTAAAVKIEYAPRNIAHAADCHDRSVDIVSQRHVYIDNVAIRYRAHRHLTGNQVKNRGIADQGPA
jgi:hypothetical protein